MFFTDHEQADYERMKARGAEFTMPPTDVTGSRIAMLNDTCGNFIQVTQRRASDSAQLSSSSNCSAIHSGVRIGHIPRRAPSW
jgi:Glyoxalase/Bleomycin resistance protein/Dioxygenase superfamily